MNFITFGAPFTNIFPIANSKNGGQLATEYNLRCRDTVGTHRSIEYEVGPSYVHGADDFEVRVLSDDAGTPVSYSTLQIMPGRAIINGHFVETFQSMTIDLLEANADLKNRALPPLKGKLSIGVRAFYATEQTIAGTLLVENANSMYVGMQLVVLPADELILPVESPDDRSKVTAHLRLATFNFNNNRISGIINHVEEKCRYISADRIANIDMMLSDTYVRKTGLNPKKLYSFAGKGTDPATGYDTWEDTTDALMVWDAVPQRTLVKPTELQAGFITDATKAYLAVPHHQVDGMTDAEENPEYYATRYIPLPTADYGANTPGLVDKTYTRAIKAISDKVEEFRTTLHGKQILYLETKDADTVLPAINPAWNVGDYILVGQDFTADEAADGVRAPSTLYVVLPGVVSAIEFVTKIDDSDIPPASLTGACLGKLTYDADSRDPEPGTSDPTVYPVFFTDEDEIRGIPNTDYFLAVYLQGDHYSMYYYKVLTAGPRAYSSYVPLTGEIPLAQEDVIGGFLNVNTDYTDNGYVYRDEYGRLKLLDYQLLRSGTLAYQLGEDLTFPTGMSTEEVQTYLNEYVNQRIAFPPTNALMTASTPNVINLYIYLTAEDAAATLNICGIDSRFNTSVYVHILGSANSNTTINIYDCQKIRIDNDIAGTPIINVYRSCLYYDPYVFNYIRTCNRGDTTFTGFEDIKLWYEQFTDEDANLVVNDMTVSQLDAPVIPDEIDYWHTTEANDNRYLTALHSITFSGDGTVVGCGLLLANQSTDNVDPGDKIIVGDFELPQGSALSYPKACMQKQLKITGTFVSAYYSDQTWYTTNTAFSAITAVYDQYDMTTTIKGNIAFHSTTTLITAEIGATSIPVWETDTYHLFYGGAIS